MTLNMSQRSSTLTLDFDSRTSANKSKFIKDRVTHVARSFGSLCDNFGAIARKHAKLRDKDDELCSNLLSYAESTTYNSSSKASLSQLSKELACCNDYQDAMVRRIEGQVVEPLMIFDTVIKDSREEIQSAFNAYDKEQKTKRHVDTMRERNPSDRHKLNQAETELQKAKVQASRSAKALEEAIDSFEKKKLKDLKQILGSYIRIQMAYHAKSLEALTKSYQNLAVFDPEEDLEEFRNILHPTSAAERQEMIRSTVSGSRYSLNSQKSETSLRSSGGRPTTPKKALPAPSGGRFDMFSAQAGARSSTPQRSPQQKSGSPQRASAPPPASSMLGEEDSESDDYDSESELEEVKIPARQPRNAF